MAEALSMRVVYYDQASVMPHGRAECIADFKEFLGITDFLVVNAPKYSGVIVGDSEMKLLKKGAWVLNASGHDGVIHHFITKLTILYNRSISKL